MGWIIIFIVAAAGAGFVYFYNDLVQKQNLLKESLSGIDVQLKRRHDVIPKLVEAVSGYMHYEQDILKNITELRSQVMIAQQISEKAAAEDHLSQSLRNVFAIAEKYPDLKADQGFMDLQKNISLIEDEIQFARRYYNATVRNYNILIDIFPSNLVAQAFRFTPAEFFGLESPEDKRSSEIVL